MKSPKKCLDSGFDWGGEDVRMGGILYRNKMLINDDSTIICMIAGQCMTKLNVTVGDSRDSGGRAR